MFHLEKKTIQNIIENEIEMLRFAMNTSGKRVNL